MSDTKSSGPVVVSGIGFPGALFLLFLALKLTGCIQWSWLWVSAPLWVPLAFSVLVVCLMVVVVSIVGMVLMAAEICRGRR